MSLRAAIASAVSGAIVATGDIAETVTYTAKSAATYDVANGTLSKTDTTYSIKAIIAPFGSAGLDGELNPNILAHYRYYLLVLIYLRHQIVRTPLPEGVWFIK